MCTFIISSEALQLHLVSWNDRSSYILTVPVRNLAIDGHSKELHRMEPYESLYEVARSVISGTIGFG